MKKQDKSFLIFGLLIIVFISLWFATGEIQEGFKEGAKPMARAPRAAPAPRAAAAAPITITKVASPSAPMQKKAIVTFKNPKLVKTKK